MTAEDVTERSHIFTPTPELFANQACIVLPPQTSRDWLLSRRTRHWTHLYVKVVGEDGVLATGDVTIRVRHKLGLFPDMKLVTRRLGDTWIPLSWPIPADELHHQVLEAVVTTDKPFEGGLLFRALSIKDLMGDLRDHIYLDELGDIQCRYKQGGDGIGDFYDLWGVEGTRNLLPHAAHRGRAIHYDGEL